MRDIESAELTADRQAREEALKVTRSFIVKAPAGSGKTQLLTLRFLALLGVVEEPEEILAITFTKAATAEMRERVIGALQRVEIAGDATQRSTTMQASGYAVAGEAGNDEPALARKALVRAKERGWRLLEQPHRLNIQTIDSLCLKIAHEAPLLSRLGGQLQPTEDADPLYALAARRTLERLADGPEPLRAALRHLLLLRNVSVGECEKLIAEMLCRRDQWLFATTAVQSEDDWASMRKQLEAPLRREHARVVAWVKGLLRGPHGEQLLELAQYACGNEPQVAIHELRGIASVEELVHAGHLRCVRALLLTGEKHWFAPGGVTKRLGFPTPADGGSKVHKEAFKALLVELQTIDGLLDALCAADELPAESFAEDEWRTVRSVFTALLHASAQLRVVFAEQGAIDFVEAGITAAYAMRDTEVRRRWSGRIHHLLVDEFQDTSRRQYELLQQIVSGWEPGEGRSCFLVGDPMQSVYLFRQADLALFNEVARHGFGDDAGAVSFDLLTLRRNYRSTAGIVEPLNKMFAALPSCRDFVPAVADAETDRENAMHVVSRFKQDGVEDDVSEAELAVATIRKHLPAIETARAANGEFRVGVLVRAKRHVAEIAAALRAEEIAYRAIEIETLEERQEVRDLLSLVRALLSPLDRVAWLAVLRAPWCGLTLKDLHILSGEDDRVLLREPLPRLLASRMALLSEDGHRRAARVFAVLQLAVQQRFAGVFSADPNGFAAWIERTWESLNGSDCVDASQYENVQAFFGMLATVRPDGLDAGQESIMARVERLFAQPLPGATERIGVQLITIHKAKGLGFDVVLVPGIERPARSADSPLLQWMERTHCETGQRELLIAPIGGKGEESSLNYKWVRAQRKREERDEQQRLLYVASTRARRELHLFGSVTLKQGMIRKPDHGSLLAAGWAALEQEYIRQRPEQPAGRPVLAQANHAQPPGRDPRGMRMGAGVELAASAEGGSGQLLRRLPFVWEMDLQGTTDSTAPPSDHANELLGRVIQKDKSMPGSRPIEKAVGVAMHGLLQQAASLDESNVRWDLSAASSATYWRNIATALLRHEGLSGRELPAQVERLFEMLRAALSHPHGRWVLGHRREARSESAWTILNRTDVKMLRADRLFVAGEFPLLEADSHLWIVDYKTTLDSNGPGELREERARHETQLAAYGEAVKTALKSDLPLRLALYYPAVPHLDWWEG